MQWYKRGVSFDGKHTNEWDLLLSKVSMTFPEPKTYSIEVPGRDGEIDLTESLTKDVKYKNRKITLEFNFIKAIKSFTGVVSQIATFLHGKSKSKIIIDGDDAYYYIGRVTINKKETDVKIGKLVLEVDADPYKYERYLSDEEWVWDDFSFSDGIIYNLKNIEVRGNKELIVIGRRKHVTARYIVKGYITIEFNSIKYKLQDQEVTIPEIIFQEGENKVLLSGYGTLTISYRGGCL